MALACRKQRESISNWKRTMTTPPPQLHAAAFTNRYMTLKNCRYGPMIFNRNDAVIGRSLDLYGEWCEAEMETLGQLMRPGNFMLDVGANIGTHTVFFAKKVEERRCVRLRAAAAGVSEFVCEPDFEWSDERTEITIATGTTKTAAIPPTDLGVLSNLSLAVAARLHFWTINPAVSWTVARRVRPAPLFPATGSSPRKLFLVIVASVAR